MHEYKQVQRKVGINVMTGKVGSSEGTMSERRRQEAVRKKWVGNARGGNKYKEKKAENHK